MTLMQHVSAGSWQLADLAVSDLTGKTLWPTPSFFGHTSRWPKRECQPHHKPRGDCWYTLRTVLSFSFSTCFTGKIASLMTCIHRKNCPRNLLELDAVSAGSWIRLKIYFFEISRPHQENCSHDMNLCSPLQSQNCSYCTQHRARDTQGRKVLACVRPRSELKGLSTKRALTSLHKHDMLVDMTISGLSCIRLNW